MRQHLEEFKKEETIEFSILNWENLLIFLVMAKEVETRITNLKKKNAPGARKINAQLLQHATINIMQQITNIYNAILPKSLHRSYHGVNSQRSKGHNQSK